VPGTVQGTVFSFEKNVYKDSEMANEPITGLDLGENVDFLNIETLNANPAVPVQGCPNRKYLIGKKAILLVEPPKILLFSTFFTLFWAKNVFFALQKQKEAFNLNFNSQAVFEQIFSPALFFELLVRKNHEMIK